MASGGSNREAPRRRSLSLAPGLDYARARDWYKKAADLGDLAAMVDLGLLYENGQGVAPDYAAAGDWFQRAAQKGNTDAMTDLGALYAGGRALWHLLKLPRVVPLLTQPLQDPTVNRIRQHLRARHDPAVFT